MKKNNKGFTLIEMLMVVAIIAILILIAIPVFNSALVNVRVKADEANIRSAYAVAAKNLMSTGETGVALTNPMQSDGEEITLPNGQKYTTVSGEQLQVSVDTEGTIEIDLPGK